jgi:3-(3-hydroxy-phenyl)propionate hydroxylase
LLLLVFGPLSATGLQRLRALCAQSDLCCVQVLGPHDPAVALEHVRDPLGHVRGACHTLPRTQRFGAPDAWALLRPNAYLAARGQRLDAALVRAVARAMGALESKA